MTRLPSWLRRLSRAHRHHPGLSCAEAAELIDSHRATVERLNDKRRADLVRREQLDAFDHPRGR